MSSAGAMAITIMAFANGSCKLSVQTPDLGEAQEEITVSYEGDPLEIGFNAAYLLEIFKYIPTDEVRLTFKAPERAATCEPVGWDDPASYLALVMTSRDWPSRLMLANIRLWPATPSNASA